MFSKKLNQKLDKYHLLKHPFYEIFWNEGKLTREIIKDYAEQYYQHVKAFPRYISATHSICDDIEKRKILLENLQDEENKDSDHPKLWKNFAKAIGADANKIDDIKPDWLSIKIGINNAARQEDLDDIYIPKWESTYRRILNRSKNELDLAGIFLFEIFGIRFFL